MTADAKTPEGFSLKRWSRVKREAARAAQAPVVADPPPSSIAPANATSPARAVMPAPSVATTTSTPAPTSTPDAALPPIDSLTIDSDFTAFLQPKVDEAVKRRALKKLFGNFFI
jgi:hypothetical protein